MCTDTHTRHARLTFVWLRCGGRGGGRPTPRSPLHGPWNTPLHTYLMDMALTNYYKWTSIGGGTFWHYIWAVDSTGFFHISWKLNSFPKNLNLSRNPDLNDIRHTYTSAISVLHACQDRPRLDYSGRTTGIRPGREAHSPKLPYCWPPGEP